MDPFEKLCLRVGFKQAKIMSQSVHYCWPGFKKKGLLAWRPSRTFIYKEAEALKGVSSKFKLSSITSSSRKHTHVYKHSTRLSGRFFSNKQLMPLSESLVAAHSKFRAMRDYVGAKRTAAYALRSGQFRSTHALVDFSQSRSRSRSLVALILPKSLEDLDTEFFMKRFASELSSTRKACVVNQDLLVVGGLVHRMRITSGLVLPSDVPIHVTCGSKDVVHSWAVPGLGIKIDCIPGFNCHRRVLIR